METHVFIKKKMKITISLWSYVFFFCISSNYKSILLSIPNNSWILYGHTFEILAASSANLDELILDFILAVCGMEVGMGWVKSGGGGNSAEMSSGDTLPVDEFNVCDKCAEFLWCPFIKRVGECTFLSETGKVLIIPRGEGKSFWLDDDDEWVGDAKGDTGACVTGSMLGRSRPVLEPVGDGVPESNDAWPLACACMERVIPIFGTVGVVVPPLSSEELLLYFFEIGWSLGGNSGRKFWLSLTFRERTSPTPGCSCESGE